MGVQVCSADGSHLEACQCGGGPLDSGSGGMDASGDTSVDAPNDVAPGVDAGPCATHVYYAGKIDGATSAWHDLAAAGGQVGLAGGNAACVSAGADHVCDYEEVLKAQAHGELATIVAGTTAWVQRTTTALVNGVPSAPGSGGNCVNWTALTNNNEEGEYATFDTTGVPTFHLDDDTVFDPSVQGHVNVHNLPCGGVTRSILCCKPVCP